MTLSYRQIRLAWCRKALQSLVRRWGIYLLVGGIVLGGAGSSALDAMTALAAWCVLPLLQAAQQSNGQAFGMSIAYALAGAALAWGLSPVLWPRSWAEAERALPVTQRERQLSDLTVTALGLTPLFTVYLAGFAIWTVKSPPWFGAVRETALAMLALSMGLSLILGMAILGWRRSGPLAASASLRHRAVAQTAASRQVCSATMALLVLPLWRGPARRSGRFFQLSLATLLAVDVCLIAWPHHASWWLAVFAALAQTLTTRLNVLASAELGLLHAACVALPVAPSWLRRARQAIALLPLAVGSACLLALLLNQTGALHASVLAVYVLAVLTGNSALLIAAATSSKEQAETSPAARVSWWLLVLVVQLALASEVMG